MGPTDYHGNALEFYRYHDVLYSKNICNGELRYDNRVCFFQGQKYIVDIDDSQNISFRISSFDIECMI